MAKVGHPRRDSCQLAQALFVVVLLGLVGGGSAWGQVAGEYRSKQGGNWSSTNTWERFNGTTWVAAVATPTSLDGQITIRTGHTVTVAASVPADQVSVQAGGQITVNSTFILSIVNGTGTDLDVFGTVNVAGTLTINASAAVVIESGGILQNSGTVNTTGTLTFASGGKYQHTYVTNAGTIPTATWNAGSTCEITGYTTYSTANSPPGGLGQNFYNLTWNCPGQTGTITLHGNIAAVNGDFTVVSTGSGTLMARQNGDGTTLNLTIGGNLNVQGGTLDANNGGTAATINLGGSYNGTGGVFLCSGAGGLAFNFTGVNKTFTQSAGAINTANMSFTVNSGASLTLNNGVSVSNGQSFTVSNNGTLHCGTNVISGAGTFTLSSGGTLGLGDPNCVGLSGASGNIQTTIRSFTAAATYVINGTVPQFVGVGLSGFPVFVQNLAISNSAGVTLGINLSVYGTLTLASGVLNTGTNVISVITAGSAAISGGGGGSYINGTLQKAFNTTGNPQSFAFPIGDASNYTPVTLSSLNVTTAGSLTARTVAGEHPNVSTSGINPNKDVTRYWTLTNSPNGIAVSSYSAAFNFVSGDADAGASTANFVVRRYAGSWSTTTTGTRNATNTQATGLSAFGDFAVGEPAIDHYIVTATSPQTAGTAFNTTVTAQDIFNQTVPDSTTVVTMSSSTGNAQFDSNGDTTFADNTKTLSNGTFTISTRDNVAETVNLTATDSNSKTGTRNGVVVNPAPPNKLAFTTQPQNTTAGATMAGVVVRVQDQFGNNLSRAGTNVSLTLNGGGSLNGTTTVATAANGSATFSTLSVTNAGNKTLTASAPGLASATSSSFTINPASASVVRVETAADGSGTVVPTQNVTAGNPITVYAITRDTHGNFVANVAATVWSLPTKTGGVVDGDLVPAGDSKSAVFAGRLTGTATVRATSGALATADSGTLTVIPGAATNLFLTLPGQTFTNGIGISGTVSNQTAGTPFNMVKLTATDPFTNIVMTYTGAKTINYSGPGGSPSYTTSVTFTNGQSSNTLATTLLKAETTTITATDGILAGIPSSSLTVNPGAFSRLQLLMPGEAAAPGSASGKTGTAAAQSVGGVFNVTVNAVDANWNLISTNDTVAITSSDSSAILPTNGALSGGTQTFGVTFETAGNATVTASDVTHTGITADTGSVTAVSPGIQTITFSSPGNQTYGVAPITLGGNASSGLAVSYSVTAGPATVSGNTLTITGAGSVTIQASQAGNANWNAATPVSWTISVAQKSLTGSITANNKAYDGTTTATIASRALAGVINSDAVSLSGGAAAFADKSVGNGKAVTATGLSLSGADAGNYVLASSTATTTANITAKGLTVAAVNQTKVYGATNPVLTVNYSGFVTGEDASVLSGSPTLNTAADTNSPVAGSPYPITSTQGTLNAANYGFTFVAGTLTVSKAELIARADDQSRVHGAINPVFTISYSGLVNAEAAAVIHVPPTASTLADTNSPSGSFAITLSGGSDDNYNLTLVDGILTVTQGPPTITSQPQSLTVNLGGTAQFNVQATGTGSLTYQWLFNGNPVVAATDSTLAITNSQTSNAGNYSVIVDDGATTVSSGAVLTVNQPPTLAVIPDQAVNEQTTLTVATSATDPDGGPLTYQLTLAPAGAVIDSGGVVTWTPTETQGPSTNVITVKLTDNGTPAMSDSKSFTVVVNEVNAAPVLTVPASQTVRVGAMLTVSNIATDTDVPANLLTFSLTSAPAGMAIDSATGVITWTPMVSPQSSTNVVTVRVTDSGQPALSDVKSFTVTAVGVGQRIIDIQPSNGVIVLTLEGIPGETYHIQATPTLNPPISWSVIGTNTAGTDALFQFTDADASLYPIRFYRSVKP